MEQRSQCTVFCWKEHDGRTTTENFELAEKPHVFTGISLNHLANESQIGI